ncbi:AAA family ATPase [Campylobacter lari]|uniref:AAA family ATPase n=1 Tax=Campylobacter lari TaxID=201 RepID=UPI001C7D3A0E|nr:AAA family ATPase [Campylobacter lari]MBX2683618.1 AAA family ATPase [Campylobacter lari]MCV3539953.1 ATP-binding protein [Campylobacter lari]MCW0226948.1 ATP-binding protein [Campylobacter lari]MCW0242317.1 ATP-binding protein [Campylobacter lari]MCW0255197.1 ATP-binding protein [Campylobacter lari]
MKLVKCKIENFRNYENTEFNFSDLSVIIGKNDVGKSTLFDALDIFFENNKALEDDVNINSNENKFSITCFFQVEPQTQINIDASESERTQTSLESEYLLNQENLLQIKKNMGKRKVKQNLSCLQLSNQLGKTTYYIKDSRFKKITLRRV